MTKHLFLSFLLSFFMTSCVTVSVLTETPSLPPFVTSTLPPTKGLTPPPVFTAITTATTDAVIVADLVQCKNGAVLLEDVTIPDNSIVPAGKIFTKTWRFKNTGTCTWGNFTVHYVSGERMNAPASVPVPETATRVIVDAGNAPALLQSPSVPLGSPAISIGTINIYCQYTYSENAGYVQELASLINQARGDAGLSALTLSPLLTQAAQGHSINMACNNFLGHEGSDGSRFGTLVRAVGYLSSFQEIIAIGTPQNAMGQWSADIGHREIVLNALASEMGIGYAYNANSNFGGYFTVDIH